MRGGFKDWFERSDWRWFQKRLPKMAGDWIDIRNLNDYQYWLQFTVEDLKQWQMVLEVGSGLTQLFATQVVENVPGVEVFPVDPLLGIDATEHYTEEFLLGNNRLRPSVVGKAVSADALHLPFADQSFGAVLALFSVPKYLKKRYRFKSNYEKAVTQMAKEFIRVLRVGGEARMCPVWLEEVQTINSTLGDLKKFVEIEYRPAVHPETGEKQNWGLLIIRRIA